MIIKIIDWNSHWVRGVRENSKEAKNREKVEDQRLGPGGAGEESLYSSHSVFLKHRVKDRKNQTNGSTFMLKTGKITQQVEVRT